MRWHWVFSLFLFPLINTAQTLNPYQATNVNIVLSDDFNANSYILFESDGYGIVEIDMEMFLFKRNANGDIITWEPGEAYGEFGYNIPSMNDLTVYSFQWVQMDGIGSPELIIRWDFSNANSGIYDGFEMQQKGFQVWNVDFYLRYMDMVNMLSYMQYSAPEDMPEGEHGKSYEGSFVQDCEISFPCEFAEDGSMTIPSMDYRTDVDFNFCDIYRPDAGTYLLTDGQFIKQ